MSLEETNAAIKEIVNKIEGVNFFSQQESVVDATKPYATEQHGRKAVINLLRMFKCYLNFRPY